jgi:hypothetical protein
MQRQLTFVMHPVPFFSSATVVKLELVAQAQMPWARVLLQGSVLGEIGLHAYKINTISNLIRIKLHSHR